MMPGARFFIIARPALYLGRGNRGPGRFTISYLGPLFSPSSPRTF